MKPEEEGLIEITEDDFSIEEMMARAKRPEAGATVTFALNVAHFYNELKAKQLIIAPTKMAALRS